jgi:hypothetical protein
MCRKVLFNIGLIMAILPLLRCDSYTTSAGRLQSHHVSCDRLALHLGWDWLVEPIAARLPTTCLALSSSEPEACQRQLLCPLYARTVFDSDQNVWNVLLIRALGQGSPYKLSVRVLSRPTQPNRQQQLDFECVQNVTSISNHVSLSSSKLPLPYVSVL